jgi:hypothetical protein
VAETVVHQLEPVEIEEHQGVGVRPRLVEQPGDVFDQQGTVWEVGQGVVGGTPLEFELERLALRDVPRLEGTSPSWWPGSTGEVRSGVLNCHPTLIGGAGGGRGTAGRTAVDVGDVESPVG